MLLRAEPAHILPRYRAMPGPGESTANTATTQTRQHLATSRNRVENNEVQHRTVK
jgi:hypothetical protein